jgi:hypothetical protein
VLERQLEQTYSSPHHACSIIGKYHCCPVKVARTIYNIMFLSGK